MPIATPRSEDITLGGLTQRVHHWGGGAGHELVILLHGFLDTGRSFDFLAGALLERRPGLRILSVDWRGHGCSEWAPKGAYYYFADYVRDLEDLIKHVGGGPVTLVGHSMGGNVALYYAGARPKAVTRLAALESVVLPDTPMSDAPHRMSGWLDALARSEATPAPKPRPKSSIIKSLERGMPYAPPEALAHLAPLAARREGDGYVMRFDPLHRTRGPYPYYLEQAKAFWRRITCPVLAFEGEKSVYIPGDIKERYEEFGDLTRRVISGAGHGMHVENPDEVAEALCNWGGF